MPAGGAHFTSEELHSVLAQYDIGKIVRTRTLTTGSRRAPKKIIVSEQGTFLLKRRARGKDDLYHVAFAHEVQDFLKRREYSVAGLVKTLDGNTALSLDGHTYELFNFKPGQRFDGSVESVRRAGAALAQLHEHFRYFVFKWEVLKRTYHDSASVRGHLAKINREEGPHEPGKGWGKTAASLSALYDQSSKTVNEAGFAEWGVQIVHGDWHPGNMLFLDGEVTCVLDFDSARIAPPITDIANGALQFSIVGGPSDPCRWPSECDRDRLRSFVAGYRVVADVPEEMLKVLPDLMIEIMIAEAVVPIAATGSFAHLSGIEFLKMILRKCRWIDEHRDSVTEDVFGKE